MRAAAAAAARPHGGVAADARRCTEQRVRISGETFAAALPVKAACWEEALTARVASVRKRERASIFRAMLLKGANSAINFALP